MKDEIESDDGLGVKDGCMWHLLEPELMKHEADMWQLLEREQQEEKAAQALQVEAMVAPWLATTHQGDLAARVKHFKWCDD